MLGFVLEGSHGRMIANKEREWAHIGYWPRQDTIIGLNSSSEPCCCSSSSSSYYAIDLLKNMSQAQNMSKLNCNQRQDRRKSDQIPQMIRLKLGN